MTPPHVIYVAEAKPGVESYGAIVVPDEYLPYWQERLADRYTFAGPYVLAEEARDD